MRKQVTGKKRKIYAEILRLLPVTVLRFTLFTHTLSAKDDERRRNTAYS